MSMLLMSTEDVILPVRTHFMLSGGEHGSPITTKGATIESFFQPRSLVGFSYVSMEAWYCWVQILSFLPWDVPLCPAIVYKYLEVNIRMGIDSLLYLFKTVFVQGGSFCVQIGDVWRNDAKKSNSPAILSAICKNTSRSQGPELNAFRLHDVRRRFIGFKQR